MNAPASPLAAQLDSAMQWWELAGLSHDFHDDATDWLAPVEPLARPVETRSDRNAASNQSGEGPSRDEPVEEAETPAIDLLGESPPQDLASFRKWWLEAPGLDAIGPRGRVAPRGNSGAELMILVIDPEAGDGEKLLSGPQGALLERMLSAMGLDEDAIYLASALPRHTPMPDTAAAASAGMAAVLAHHIALASPKRVLAFGANILPLLGHELTRDVQSLREINQESGSMPLMVSEGLDSMMAMPRLKARFWRRWIEWSPR